MPNLRLSMRKLKEILRLSAERGLSNRLIAKCSNVSHVTVAEYIRRAETAGLSWPLPEGMDDGELERRMFRPDMPQAESVAIAVPDWGLVHKELKRKGMTLHLLWEEYKEKTPGGYLYSWFCEQYRAYCGKLAISMRQIHKAGEKQFVDYAGQTVPVTDRLTGEVSPAQIFVSVLGASSYTYAEATWTQTLPDWVGSHIRAFEFFQGVVDLLVPDNLRSAISKTCRYEPDINPTYQEMAIHYGVAVIPARVRKPQDKAKVEVAVQIVERWILASLRNRTFFSLVELNAAIRELLERLNSREFPKMKGESRRSLYEKLDKPALKSLPLARYEFGKWQRAGVNIDHHVQVEEHFYSVPYQLTGEKVDVRITSAIVELFYKSKRVASHPRSFVKWQPTTLEGHRPKSHQRYNEWSPSRLVSWAEKTGPATAEVAGKIMASKPHPEQGYRSVLGLLNLERKYDAQRLESACKLALALHVPRYQSVKSILEKGKDKEKLVIEEEPSTPIEHSQIRGGGYYEYQTHKKEEKE